MKTLTEPKLTAFVKMKTGQVKRVTADMATNRFVVGSDGYTMPAQDQVGFMVDGATKRLVPVAFYRQGFPNPEPLGGGTPKELTSVDYERLHGKPISHAIADALREAQDNSWRDYIAMGLGGLSCLLWLATLVVVK